MALGVLEDKILKHVPGTVYVLDDVSRTAVEAERDTHSKRDKTGQIILVPQPSDSPDDPLVRLPPLFCNAGFVELTEC